MSLYFQTDMYSLMCGLQSRERWSASLNTLDSCLGEKTEHQANYSRVAAQQSNMIGAELASLGTVSTGHQEGWTECFQDLQTWCPPAQDELNTPQVTTECFNFGTFDQCQASRNLDDFYPADLMPDTLGGDMAYLQSPTFGLHEENNNDIVPPFLKLPQTSGAQACGGKLYSSFPTNTKSPLKSTSSNILLSQSFVDQPAMNKGREYRPEPALRLQDGLIPFDLEDEENYLVSVPPEQVARRVQDFRVPSPTDVPVKKERPKLKLDVNLPTPTPTAPVVMPSTPEVQNVLSEPNMGFDLIKYVVSGDYVNLGSVCGLTSSKAYESVERDHDYTDPVMKPKNPSNKPVFIKSELQSRLANPSQPISIKTEPQPMHAVPSEPVFIKTEPPQSRLANPNQPVYIKSEPLSPASCAATATMIENKIRTTERGRPVKRRSVSNSDFIFDSDLEASDDSLDWEPSTSKGGKAQKIKKSRISKASAHSRADSDVESVASSFTTDKYRELRDKNNEASRRSRLNRKQRDTEMKKTAEKLDSENRALKARAERMQKLVLDMREIIMKTIKGANKR